MALLVTNISLEADIDAIHRIANRLGVSIEQILGIELLKKSVDARRRPPVWFGNFRVELQSGEAELVSRGIHGVRLFNSRDAARYKKISFDFEQPLPWPEEFHAVVVGAGPAGLFCALRFAEAGAAVTLIERGGPVEQRHYSVRDFWRHGTLDPESNVVYGEGGAGAFSDGKIYTRRRDGELGWVFQRLVDFGADPEILKEGWAHLGTDRIRAILPQLRARIIELGGRVMFNTCAQRLIVEEGTCTGVVLADGTRLRSSTVVMATGHSARDSWQMMLDVGAAAEARPIRIGARIEHPQRLIDEGRYGQPRGELPPASYRLRSNPTDGRRSAHTFCMCPGGTVVGATSEQNRVVVNGMSYSGRRAWYANSAIIVELTLEDIEKHTTDYPVNGHPALRGVAFQDAIEVKAYELGDGDFKAPAQRVEDFLQRLPSEDLPRTSFPNGVTPANLWELFPMEIADGLAAAITFFDTRIPGFAGADGVLIAPETRTTAPLRFLRTEKMCSTTIEGLMPIGEGAGYAGGIASAALEGFRAAEVWIQKLKGLSSEAI